MKKIFDWTARIVAVVILIPAFYFKLSGSESSIATFAALDAEPFGRYVVGLFGLGVVFLLLIPRTKLVRGDDRYCDYGGGNWFSYFDSRFSR